MATGGCTQSPLSELSSDPFGSRLESDAVLFDLVRLAPDQFPYGGSFVQWHKGIDQARCREAALAHLADDALGNASPYAFTGQDLLGICLLYA
jgi:hypothetical protein